MADVEKLIIALKRTCPASVRVIDATDNAREVAVPQNARKRWAQVVGCIINRPWVRCEFLDKKGLVLGYFDNDGAASDLEPISDTGGPNSPLAMERFMRLILEGQKVALGYRDKEHSELLGNVSEMMKVMTEGMRQMMVLHQAQLNVAAEVAAMQATAEAGGEMEQWLKVMEAAPESIAKLAPMFAMLFGRNRLPAGGKKDAKPTNGTPANGAKP